MANYCEQINIFLIIFEKLLVIYCLSNLIDFGQFILKD